MPNKTITIEATIKAPIETVWQSWTEPEHITKWAFASDNWEAPYATNDLQVKGKFLTKMAAKDGSSSFEFTGTYTTVKFHELIAYTIADGRTVTIQFNKTSEGVHIIETFEIETENTEELQRNGWQAILNNFKQYTELL